jgi:hypothetical protein
MPEPKNKTSQLSVIEAFASKQRGEMQRASRKSPLETAAAVACAVLLLGWAVIELAGGKAGQGWASEAGLMLAFLGTSLLATWRWAVFRIRQTASYWGFLLDLCRLPGSRWSTLLCVLAVVAAVTAAVASGYTAGQRAQSPRVVGHWK